MDPYTEEQKRLQKVFKDLPGTPMFLVAMLDSDGQPTSPTYYPQLAQRTGNKPVVVGAWLVDEDAEPKVLRFGRVLIAIDQTCELDEMIDTSTEFEFDTDIVEIDGYGFLPYFAACVFETRLFYFLAFESMRLDKGPKDRTPIGARLEVFSGDGEQYLGEGTYIGNATVYVAEIDNGLVSLEDAERRPKPQDLPAGAKIVKIKDNPKIQLDDGSIVYGCQVYWRPIEEDDEVRDNDGI